MKTITILILFIAIQVKSEDFTKQINADLDGDGHDDKIDIFYQQQQDKKETKTYPCVAIISLRTNNGFVPIKIINYDCDSPKAFDIRVVDFDKKSGKEIFVGEYGVGVLHVYCHVFVYTIKNSSLRLIAKKWFEDKSLNEISIKNFNKIASGDG